jgi:hypothetical protein
MRVSLAGEATLFAIRQAYLNGNAVSIFLSSDVGEGSPVEGMGALWAVGLCYLVS